MDKIVFTNEKERIAFRLSVRKEIIREILEDCRCRKCKAFYDYRSKDNINFEDL